MRTGKLPESIVRRSVLRQLNKNHLQSAPFYGADCAFMQFPQQSAAAYTVVNDVPGFADDPGKLLLAAVNNLTAAQAVPAGYLLSAVIPETYDEQALKRDMTGIASAAGLYGMQPFGGHTQVSSQVTGPVYSITGIGKYQLSDQETEQAQNGAVHQQKCLEPGQDLVVTRYIALGGTAALAIKFEQELKEKYPFSLINQAKEFEKLMCSAADARAITHFGTCAMHDLSQGGIFGALREMAERADVGLEVDLKKIPVKQETIEICEYFDINPYYFYSAGALLVGTRQGEELVEYLQSQGIPATVIGRTTSQNDRVIHNGEELRYLDRPQQEEWYRRFH